MEVQRTTATTADENFVDEPTTLTASTNDVSPSNPSLSPFFVKGIFLLLGVGILIPWNAFVSAKPYFQARLCQSGTVIVNFELWFGIVWNCSSVFSLGMVLTSSSIMDYCRSRLGYNTVLYEAQEQHEQSNNSESNNNTKHDHSFWLVMVPLGFYLGVFLLTSGMVLVPTMSPQLFGFLTLVGLAICGTCGAIATAGIVSTAGLFEAHVGITPFFSGQALGGLAVSMANFVASSLEDPQEYWGEVCDADHSHWHDSGDATPISSKIGRQRILLPATSPPSSSLRLLRDRDSVLYDCSEYSETDWAVFAYFFAGCCVLTLCLVGYSIIQRSKPRINNGGGDSSNTIQEETQIQDNRPSDTEPLTAGGIEGSASTGREDYRYGTKNSATLQPQGNEPGSTPEEWNNDIGNMMVDSEDHDGAGEEPTITVKVASIVLAPASCVFLVFTVTLALFPSWISQLKSTYQCKSHFRLFNDLYIPGSFVAFNAGDLMGRLLAEKVSTERFPQFSMVLVVAALCRVVFFPLFLLCLNDHQYQHWAVVIPSDLYSAVVQTTFALSNGLLVSCSFMHASNLVGHNNPDHQEKASEIMTFAVFLGLLSGSLLSFPFDEAVSYL